MFHNLTLQKKKKRNKLVNSPKQMSWEAQSDDRGGAWCDKAVYIDESLMNESSTKLGFEDEGTPKRLHEYKQ